MTSTKARLRALTVAVVCSLAAALTVALPSQQPAAQAADLRAFDPGFIISDALFYDSHAMNAASIQTFLNQKGSSCAAPAGNTCLKDFQQTTWTRTADTRCQGTYAGAGNEPAAQIIAKVADACGINPQALLVMLQKEQGLVTASAGGSSDGRYRSAMGYGCPDTAPCDAQYYGFFNQVYMAAHQYQNYAMNPTSYGHRAGMVNQLLYNPDGTCGSSAVYVQNQATASLYNYTPYQPNAAALAAGYGTGDGCSAYGNRNFWNYFTDWFGPTTQRPPFGSLDAATSPSNGLISVGGWALDPDTTAPINVHVYVDGRFAAALTADQPRPDVGSAFRRGDNHGFNGPVQAGNGTHQVCLWAIDSAGGSNTSIGCANVTVINQVPIGSLDTVTTSQGRITASGWALDPDTNDPITVHLYVDGQAIQAFAANNPRADVGRIYGKGDNHGFSGAVKALAGTHQFCVYAIDSSGGTNPSVGCQSVTVTNQAPIGSLDTLTSGMESFTVTGWALDPDTTASVDVHVYVDGKWAGAFAAKNPRPDVGRIYGKGDNHGFTGPVTATYGKHEVCIYAIDSWGGFNPRLGCSIVDVNGTAFGSLDAIGATSGQITVGGWAIDPNTTAPIQVHVYVDGNWGKALTADASRPDVGAATGMGDNHGFNGSLGAPAGTHQVCVYAIDSWHWPQPTNPQIGCRSVTVP